jgi:predicted MFS family arabinose efflux permease
MNSDQHSSGTPKEAPWYILGILILVYTFNFIDRQIIGILAVPIKSELGLSDSELGLMGGLAFALFYTLLGVPVAMLADQKNRTWIMTIALALWSLMTALCGLAQNFWQLAAARLGVGVGEAGGVAPAYSLISDLYPPEKRARALAVYSFGIPIGSALGIVFGGIIASYIDWRAAFFIVGIAGIALTPIFKLVVKEPKRGQFDQSVQSTSVSPAPVSDVFKIIFRKPSFWLISIGASCSSMMGYGIFFWLPSFLVRSYNLTLLDASLFYGAILLIGGIIGIWIGGVYGDKFGQKNKSAFAIVPAIAFLITIPFYFFGVLTTSLKLAAILLIIPTALGLVWLGPVISSIQHLVQPSMRTTASALFLFINNLIGIGLGTYLIGQLSEYLSGEFGDDSLRYAILAGTGFYLFAAFFFFIAAKHLNKDWQQ